MVTRSRALRGVASTKPVARKLTKVLDVLLRFCFGAHGADGRVFVE